MTWSGKVPGSTLGEHGNHGGEYAMAQVLVAGSAGLAGESTSEHLLGEHAPSNDCWQPHLPGKSRKVAGSVDLAGESTSEHLLGKHAPASDRWQPHISGKSR